MKEIMQQDQISAAIRNLSKQEQLIISLFYVEHLTIYEVGEVLKIPHKSVLRIYKRAITRIFEQVKNE